MGELLKFFGILLKMSIYHQSLKEYWQGSAIHERPEYYIKFHMSEKCFWRVWAVLLMPLDPNNVIEQYDSNLEDGSEQTV